MGRDRAAYMREYRARLAEGREAGDRIIADGWAAAEARIRELEEEVRRLKRELAARPDNPVQAAWSHSTPAPKVRPR